MTLDGTRWTGALAFLNGVSEVRVLPGEPFSEIRNGLIDSFWSRCASPRPRSPANSGSAGSRCIACSNPPEKRDRGLERGSEKPYQVLDRDEPELTSTVPDSRELPRSAWATRFPWMLMALGCIGIIVAVRLFDIAVDLGTPGRVWSGPSQMSARLNTWGRMRSLQGSAPA